MVLLDQDCLLEQRCIRPTLDRLIAEYDRSCAFTRQDRRGDAFIGFKKTLFFRESVPDDREAPPDLRLLKPAELCKVK